MERLSKPKAFRAVLGAMIILITTVGSVLAANIAIGNSGKGAEFGQGVFTIKACDTWIQLNLVNGPTGQYGAPAGLSALTGVTIQGLNPTACKSTKFTIQAISSGGTILPLYRTGFQSGLCTSNRVCVIGRNSESDLILAVSASGVVSLYNYDFYHWLDYDSTTGMYTFTFTQPGQLARDISTLTIQSSAA